MDEVACGSTAASARLREQLAQCIERMPELLRCESTDEAGGRLLNFEDVKLILTSAFYEALNDLQAAAVTCSQC